MGCHVELRPSRRARGLRPLLAVLLASSSLAAPAALAQDATWLPNPGSSDFMTGGNWTGGTPPTGFATFGNSAITTLTFSGSRNLDGFEFDAGAPAYTFNLTSGFGVAFHTDGIINNSSNAPTFNVDNSLLRFDDTSTAGNAIINLLGGTIQFIGSSTAGAAQLNASTGTTFDFTGTAGPGNLGLISAGSIAGAGNFALGSNQLTVGSNNLSTEVSGTISGNALVKVGTGTLTLSGTNTYTGGTTISAGTIVAAHQNGGVIDAIGLGTNILLDGGALVFGASGSLTNAVTFNDDKTSILSAGAQFVSLDGGLLLGPNATAQFGLAGDTGVLILNTSPSADTSNKVIVAGGTLQDAGNTLVGLTFFASTQVNAGATLDFNDAFNQAIRNLTGAGSVITGTLPGAFLSLLVDDNTSSTFGGVISGTGHVEIESYTSTGGTMIFTGANTYEGGTTICFCSTLQLGTFTTPGSIIGDVDVLGTFNVVNSDTTGITSITNDGGLTQFFNGTSASTAVIVNRNGGILNFFDTSTAGNATITNRDGGATSFGTPFGSDTATAGNATITNRSGGATYFNALTTAGNATITNRYQSATLFFDGSNAGTATIVNRYGGLTAFSDNSSADNANITIRYGGTVFFTGTSTAGNATITNRSFGGVIFGPPIGLGFFEDSTAGTATIVNNNNGYISFGIPFGFDAPSADHATITNNSGGILEFNAFATAGFATITTNSGAETYFYDNATGGAARFITNGTGFVDFSGSFGPDSDGRITAGSIEGSGSYFIGAGNTLVVGSNNLSTVVSGVIADISPCGCFPGPGALEKVGTGTLILSGDNTYTGGTTILGGVLQLGDGGASGTILGDVVNNATFVINRSDVFAFGGIISGTGVFEQNGTGTTVFTAANTYTGGTVINAGTLQLGPGGSLAPTGALTVNLGGIFDLNGHTQTVGDFSGAGNVLLGNGLLTAGTANSTLFSGTMSGTGCFTKVGAGTLTFSGASDYTGPTTVDAGTLIVNGSIVSPTTVSPGATLGGTGALGSLTVNGGTLSPGNSIGTITVNGDLTFVGPGTYLVEVGATTADRTNVTGTATLSGAVRAVLQPGTLSNRYIILSANGGRIGTFDSLTTVNLPAFFGIGLSYTATDVLLTVTLNLGQLAGLNQNQKAVGTALDTAFNAGIPLGGAFGNLLGLPAVAMPNALSQLSGEIGTGAATAGFQSMDQFLNVMLDPFLETRLGDGTVQGRALGFAQEAPVMADAALAYGPFVTKAPPAGRLLDRRWTVWGAAYGAAGTFNGDFATVGSHNLTVRTGSFAAGVDYRVSPDSVVGFAVAGGSLSYGLDNLIGSGRGNVVQAGLYGSTRFGDNAYVSAALAYGRHDLSTDRTVAFGALVDRLSADFDANSFGGRIEAGYRLAMMTGLGVTPFAAVQVQRFDTPSYAERDLTGLAGVGLNYNGRNTTDTRSELGARFDYRMMMDSAVLTLRGRAAWGHEFDTERSIGAVFQSLPGVGFTVFGASPAADVALVSAGAELKFRNGVSLSAKFDGEFAGRTQVYAGSAAVRVNW